MGTDSTACKTTITVQADTAGKPISPLLFGIFFEDINYAADGGLYAELVRNRSFEFQAIENPEWNQLTGWELTKRGEGEGWMGLDAAWPVHPNNPHYVTLHVAKVGDGVGLINPGFDGIAVKEGEDYDLSLFARQLYMGRRWGQGFSGKDGPMPLVVRLESEEGEALGEASLEVAGPEWQRLSASIRASRTEKAARLVLLGMDVGGVALDVISLFPRKTFRNRPNGLRADLAQAIADLQPKFVRFPGGCLVHGNGLGNVYRWKDTIGPIEQRRGQANLWGYHQEVGLGYFEYFQFCEDIGAKPLPVVPSGVCCQNASHTNGTGQRALPLEEMPAYIQDVLDLIEWSNGPATSEWGAKRAAAGHPEPFYLEYLGVGNEEHITPAFEERFKMIYEAIQAKHPEITVIGTVGPFWKGDDFENGWKIADALQLPMVDEHYYESPEWFMDNLERYDGYDRNKSKVYLGEYAAHEKNRATTLRSALAEAAYMVGLERNGDIVAMTSYAPLLGKAGRTQWNPDLIYFNNTEVFPTINYYVQQMFGNNAGDVWLPVEVGDSTKLAELAVSSVKDSATGDLILKLAHNGAQSKPLQINLSGAKSLVPSAVVTTLTGDPSALNNEESPKTVVPSTSEIAVSESFEHVAPPHSLIVIRIKMSN
ncbi:alpha-N-arabinofuranosidase [Candidatus Sumerlaeota bacterium]|nr:alpha-N-arabinofuranosidase [Candidatus Sumerlaeota bacterium]